MGVPLHEDVHVCALQQIASLLLHTVNPRQGGRRVHGPGGLGQWLLLFIVSSVKHIDLTNLRMSLVYDRDPSLQEPRVNTAHTGTMSHAIGVLTNYH